MADPIMSGDPIAATAWLSFEEDDELLAGDDITARAELTDVDEVAVVIQAARPKPAEADGQDEVVVYAEVLVHLTRVQAIALAGQLAWAATAEPTRLPRGHGVNGPLA